MKGYDDEPTSAHDAFKKGFCAQQNPSQDPNAPSLKEEISTNPPMKGYKPAFKGGSAKPKRKM
jgi:hypothetical protein